MCFSLKNTYKSKLTRLFLRAFQVLQVIVKKRTETKIKTGKQNHIDSLAITMVNRRCQEYGFVAGR